MNNKDNGSAMWGFLAGAVLGGAVGAGVALLFAPQSGEETRKMLKEKAEDLSKELDEVKKEIKPKMKKAREDLAKKIQA